MERVALAPRSPKAAVPTPSAQRFLSGALICDYVEEKWPSMDLCAAMLLEQSGLANDQHSLTRICPPMRLRTARLGVLGQRFGRNADRILNRLWDYPRHLQSVAGKFDFYHVVDHSYAHLVHGLPAHQTGVHCHDLDAFRCLIEPSKDPRPAWFRAIAKRILTGLQKARFVFYSTDTIRREIERHRLVEIHRLLKAPLGVADEFYGSPSECPVSNSTPFLLHVGSCIPRKRADVLINLMARLSRTFPNLKLVKVGGAWTADHQKQIDRTGIASRIVHLRGFQETRTLASLYRKAAVVLMPSSAEGFGLPVIEALASGARVIASDLEVFREVGGDAVAYCPVGDVTAWCSTVSGYLADPTAGPSEVLRRERASRYTWSNYAQSIFRAYEGLKR